MCAYICVHTSYTHTQFHNPPQYAWRMHFFYMCLLYPAVEPRAMAESTTQRGEFPEGVQEHQYGFLVRTTDPFIHKLLFSEYPNRDLAKQAALTCVERIFLRDRSIWMSVHSSKSHSLRTFDIYLYIFVYVYHIHIALVNSQTGCLCNVLHEDLLRSF